MSPVIHSPTYHESPVVYDTGGTISKATLTATETGGSATWEMSADGGANFESCTSGTLLSFANTGTQLKWRAVGVYPVKVTNLTILVEESTMATNYVTLNGKNVFLNLTWKATPDYVYASQFRIGIGTTAITENDTEIELQVPISDGTTNDDGSNTFTGSDGGDNSTSNTTTYKEGGGNSDVTSQNLIANDTDTSKVWTIADLDTAGTDVAGAQYIGCWIYIKDATALAKFKTTGTALSIRIRTNGDADNLYYELSKTSSALAVGWNWITGDTTIVTSLTQGAGGAPSGDLDELVIEITTNNATDEFVAGDLLYDLLRQWEVTDLNGSFVTGYPTFDESAGTLKFRLLINSVQANGFPITRIGILNADATPKLLLISSLTSQSKSSTDEFAYVGNVVVQN